MRCPFCRTENRDECDKCYYCEKDLSMLRLILNKARAHFNNALEFAERDRNEEAIRELHNSLDLDHSHVNSHVVLGTLYAKLGRMNEAEEAWRQALAVDPRLDKAHLYLEKLDVARDALPLVRRQRIFMTCLLTVLALALAGLVWRSLPDPQHDDLEKAMLAYDRNDYAAAAAAIQDLVAHAPGDFHAHQAELLGRIIEADQQNHLEGAEQRLELNRTLQANRLVLEILGRRPANEYLSQATALRARILDREHENLAIAMEAFKHRETNEEDVAQTIERFRKLLDDAPPGEQPRAGLREYLDRSARDLRRSARAMKIEDALTRLESGDIDPWRLLEELAAVRSRYSRFDTDERLQSLIEKHHGNLLEKWTDHWERFLGEGQLVQAGVAVERLEKLHAINDPAGAAERTAPLRRRLQTKRAAKSLERARDAAAQGKPEQAKLYAEEALAAAPAHDDETSRAARKVLAKADAMLAESRWEWLKQNSSKFRNAQLDAEQAKNALRYIAHVEKHLPKEKRADAGDALLFYRAIAHRRVQQTHKARLAFQSLRKQFPDSKLIPLADKYEAMDDAPKD